MKHLGLFLVVLAFVFLAQSVIFAQSAASETQPLKFGSAVERSLDGNGQHFYSVALKAGDALDFQVEQVGINAAVTLTAPDGKDIITLNTRSRTGETETLLLVADVAGTYLIVVHPAVKNAASGIYRLCADRPRGANEADKNRFKAFLLGQEANKLFLAETPESRRQSLIKSKEALALWQAVGDDYLAAKTLHVIGWTNYWLEDYAPSLEYLTQALALRRKIGDRQGEATSLNALGSLYIYNNANQPGKVVEYLGAAQKIQFEIGDKIGAARTLSDLATFQHFLGDNQRARENFEQALAFHRSEKEVRGESTVQSNLGSIFLFTGEYQKALDALRQSLELQRQLPDSNRIGEAIGLSKIGQCYLKLGDLTAALDYFRQSLKILDEVDYKPSKGYVLNNIATVLSQSGDSAGAKINLEQALGFHLDAKDSRGMATTLLNLGKFYNWQGDPVKALDYFNQALKIVWADGDIYTEGAIWQGIGEGYVSLKDRPKAIEVFKKSLEQRQIVKDVSNEAVTLNWLARIERENGDLKAAWNYAAKSIELVESQRSSVINPELRSSFLASQQDFYGLAIGILMDLDEREPAAGHAARALEINERARARSLLELLGEAKTDIRQGIDPTLLAREHALRQNINFKESRRLQLLTGKYTPAQTSAAEKEIDALLAEYERTQDQIRAKSPAYAALTRPAPLGLKEIQAQLDAETLLLVYRLRGEKSYLWAVTPTEIKAFALPAKEIIEKQAREFYDTLQISFRRAAKIQTQQTAAALSNTILAPAAPLLGNKRLLVVADGALQRVPFAALTIPDSKFQIPNSKTEAARKHSEVSDTRLLIETNEIVNLPSVSVLAELRRAAQARKAAPKTLAIFADPVFTSDDERLTAKKAAPTMPRNNDALAVVTRAAADAGLTKFSRLRFSRREAEQIASFASAATQFNALDFAASRENVLKNDLSQYRILHFATHGILHNTRPELSGVVLSLVDDKGAAQDGFLRSNEIYNLRLAADLVVLSACKTALGKEVGGEGMINLTRSFFYAGTQRVLVSLWNVEDESTAELMRLFYQALLQNKLAPAAALRQAQNEMRKNPRFAAPYFWSGFVLQGDWK